MGVTLPVARTIRETVYLDRTNGVTLQIDTYDHDADTFAGVDFSTVDEWRIELVSQADRTLIEGPFSTDDDAELATGDADGLVTLKLGALAVDPGDYWLRLAVVDPQGDDTQIVHEDGPLFRVLLRFANGEG